MPTKKSSILIFFVGELLNEITDVYSSQDLLSNRLGVIQRQLERRVNTLNFPCGYRHSAIISGTQDRVLTFRVTKAKVKEYLKEIYLHPHPYPYVYLFKDSSSFLI